MGKRDHRRPRFAIGEIEQICWTIPPGEYDLWTGKKLNEPDRYLDVREALKLFLKEKHQAGLAESSIGSYKGIVERSGVLDMPVDSVQKSDLADFVYDSEVAKATGRTREHEPKTERAGDRTGTRTTGLWIGHPVTLRPRRVGSPLAGRRSS